MIAAGKGTSAEEDWMQLRIGRWGLDDSFQLNLLVRDTSTGSVRFYHQSLHQYFALPKLTKRVVGARLARRIGFIRQIADLEEGGALAIPTLLGLVA